MEGFLIQEVALKGIVKTPRLHRDALGTDGKSYFAASAMRRSSTFFGDGDRRDHGDLRRR